jgi:signal transduction histidine kinase
MAYVSQAHYLFSRVTRAPDVPLAAAAVLGLLAMGEVTVRVPDDASGTLTTALLLGLFTTVPLALVRTSLVSAATVITGATALTLAAEFPLTVAGLLAQLAVLHLAGLRLARRLWMLLVFTLAASAVIAGDSFAILVLALAATATGAGMARKLRADAIERDASQQAYAETLLEHAARGERARIARELHDVVAHHISMIAVQAETARLTTPGMPAEGAKRLVAISDTARDALTEMRRLLGVLRDDAGTTEPTRQPQPGLDQLNDLIDAARDSAGASTRLILRGHVVPLDPGVELTAYRIVQEALTNARRHAPGSAVDISLDYTEERLIVRVRDNGPGPPGSAAQAGHGLLGMRERAGMVGGTLRTGSSRAGGFLVEAALPVGTRTPA